MPSAHVICEALCREVVLEQDPVRLLGLFLWIDHLSAEEPNWEHQESGRVIRYTPPFVACPHCSAIIELEQQRIERVQECPWCGGPFTQPLHIIADQHVTP